MSATANLKIEIIECKIRILSVVALKFTWLMKTLFCINTNMEYLSQP